MNSSSATTARAWVSARDWNRFIGTPESAFLDVKSGLYRLDDPGSSAELIKDVAAFANRHGGLLLVGFATRIDGGHEIIDELKPVPAGLVDTDRYRKLVRERIQPHIRDLTVEFYSVENERGVLVIDIPPQSEAAKPFVVPGLDGKRAPTAVGVPIRDADATQWLTRSDLQRLLSAGWNAADSPRADIIKALHDAVAAAVPAPREPAPPAVGEGAGRQRLYFIAVYAAGGGLAALGHPTEPVTAIGPGLMQPLTGRDGTSGQVLTVLPDRGGAVVPGDVWDALREAGNAAEQATSIGNIGLPSIADADAPLIIRDDAQAVELQGGAWGFGRLARPSPEARWLWRPHTSRDFEMRHNNLHTGQPTELYVRAVLDVSWQDWEYLPGTLPKAVRERHRDLLGESGLAQTMSKLARRLGATVPAPTWQFASGSDSNHSSMSSHVRAQITAADGTPAVIANSTLQSGSWRSSSSVIATVDLGMNLRRIQKLTNPADVSGARGPRLSIVELIEILVSEWAAVVALPGVLEPAFKKIPFAAPPFLVFHIHAGSAPHAGGDEHTPRQLNLPDVLDFAVFGDGPHDVSRTQTGLRIVGPFEPDHAARQRLVVESIDDLALGWGFLAADVRALLNRSPGQPA